MNIERETEDLDQRYKDMAMAVKLLESLR
jgi:hypothetical protein